MVDHRLALGPRGSGIERLRQVIVNDGIVTRLERDGPVWVDNGSHKALDLLKGGTLELGVDTSGPGGLGVRVDSLDVSSKVKRLLFGEKIHEVVVGAQLHVDAGLLRLVQVDNLRMAGEVVDAILEFGELRVEGIHLLVFTLGGMCDDGLAKLADVVVLSEELVSSLGAGDRGKDGNKGSGPHGFFLINNYKKYWKQASSIN